MENKNSSKLVVLTFSVLVFCFLTGFYIFAWTGPTASPPSNNTSAPINVSAEAQTKQGNLTIGTATIKGDGSISTNLNSDKVDDLHAADLLAGGSADEWSSFIYAGNTYNEDADRKVTPNIIPMTAKEILVGCKAHIDNPDNNFILVATPPLSNPTEPVFILSPGSAYATTVLKLVRLGGGGGTKAAVFQVCTDSAFSGQKIVNCSLRSDGAVITETDGSMGHPYRGVCMWFYR